MTLQQIVTDAYLTVAVESLLAQIWHLHRARAQTVRTPGLVRTLGCRVGCSVLYVIVGTNAYVNGGRTALTLGLAVFTFITLLWQVNSRLDRRVGQARTPRRRRLPIVITIGRPIPPPEAK